VFAPEVMLKAESAVGLAFARHAGGCMWISDESRLSLAALIGLGVNAAASASNEITP